MFKVILLLILSCSQLSFATPTNGTGSDPAQYRQNWIFLVNLAKQHENDPILDLPMADCSSQEIRQALRRISPMDSPALQDDINWYISLYQHGENEAQRNFYGHVLKCYHDSFFPWPSKQF